MAEQNNGRTEIRIGSNAANRKRCRFKEIVSIVWNEKACNSVKINFEYSKHQNYDRVHHELPHIVKLLSHALV